MSTELSREIVSRRATIAAITGAGLGMALAATRSAGAQDADLANHSMVGTWLVRTPDGSLGVNYVLPDGKWMHAGSPLGMPAPDGTITYQTGQNGVWEPDPENERGIHFASIQSLFDASGAYIGTFIIDGYPSVNEDGQTLGDDWSRSFITIRDANDEVVNEIRDDGTTPPIAGVRLTAGELVFPPLHAPGATPES
jgi:hypothetical protein